MKHLSLKTRIALWFTVILTVICALILTVGISLYRTYDASMIRTSLTDSVRREAQKLESDKNFVRELEEGTLKDSEFLKGDVQLMIYGDDGTALAGLFLYDELDGLEFDESREVKTVAIGQRAYYYYDQKIRVRHEGDYWIRGIVPAETTLADIAGQHSYLFLILPVLLLLAFAGGYLLTGRFLKPVKEIDRTAEEIRLSGDLSKRIEYTDTGDELSGLSGTINAMFDRLEDNFEAERRFTSNASHELRTPVAVILAECEYAYDHAETKEELLDTVASVEKQGYRMSRLIETLLKFTRMEQNTDIYRKERTDLSAMTGSVCEDFALIADRNISVAANLQPGVYAEVNQELYRSMISNLIRNAIRYGKEEGHVYVDLTSEDREVRIVVRDDGKGIADADLPHIWDLFYRGDPSRSSEGLGLGLPLVKQIAAFHGGTVEVMSREGEGSTFTVILPASG